jgi:hypothetical protein
MDYRELNKVLKGDTYAMPRPDHILQQLSGRRWHSNFDLVSAFQQMPVREEDREKLAFVTPHLGLWEFCGMPFGINTAPAIWQRAMDSILAELRYDSVFPYFDDFLVSSFEFGDHIKHIERLLQKFREHNLKLGPDKRKIGYPEVAYLGYIVSGQGVRTDPEKTEKVQNFTTPGNVKDVRAFLGLTGFYRRFIKNYAKIAEPLVALTRGDVNVRDKWRENPECQIAFDTLKAKLITNPILSHADFKKPFRIDVDACDYAVGAVLSQEREVDTGTKKVTAWLPVVFFSRTLTAAERKWTPGEKEALGTCV